MPMQADIIRRAKSYITPEHIKRFQIDGALCLRQILTQDEIALLRDGIDWNLASPSPRVKIASKPDDPGLFIEDFCTWQHNPCYQRFIFESPIAVIAGLLMGSKETRLYHDHMLVKEPGTRQRTPWHQDQPYYNVEGRQNCSLWIPVDPVSRDASLEFVTGSHLGPWLMPRSFMDNQAKWFPEGTLAELPDIEAARENYPITGWEIAEGDLVCFHMLTLHSAAGVEHGQRRRVYSVRFLGDDMIHAPRTWTSSPEFPGLAEEMPAGVRMEHPLFPVIWENPD